MFLKNDLYFVKGLLSEDIEWSARVMIASRQIAVCHVSIYKRIRRGNGSITSQIGERNIRDILASLKKEYRMQKSMRKVHIFDAVLRVLVLPICNVIMLAVDC